MQTAPDPKKIRLFYSSIIAVLLLSLLEWSTFQAYFAEGVEQSQIIWFQGKISYVKKAETGGMRKQQFYLIEIDRYKYRFKISGTSYRTLLAVNGEKYLKCGESIAVGTTRAQIEDVKNPGFWDYILNQFVAARANPQILVLKVDEHEILHLEDYNKNTQIRREVNFYWGVPTLSIAILFFGLLAYVSWVRRFRFD